MIVSVAAGTPALALEGGPGLGALARRLGQPVLALETHPDSIATTALQAASGPAPDQRRVRAERAAARESFRLLRLLLDAQRSQEDHDLVALPLVPEPAGDGNAVPADATSHLQLIEEIGR
jgi:hypothetical protein